MTIILNKPEEGVVLHAGFPQCLTGLFSWACEYNHLCVLLRLQGKEKKTSVD